MPMMVECAHCGARMQYPEGGDMLICDYCGATMAAPVELQQARAREEARKMLTWPELRRKRWFQIGVLIFLAIFVLPTCLAIVGSLLGIIAGVGAPLAAIILQLLVGR